MPSALVVDDSPVHARGVALILQTAGYTPVEIATDWAECRGALGRIAPALIVLDVEMKGMMSGDVMAAQLRRNPRCTQSKIVLYSGLKERDLQALAARSGADAYQAKGNEAALVETCHRLVPVEPAAT